MKNVKMLKPEGNWDEQLTKLSSRKLTQAILEKYLEFKKEIKQNWKEANSFDKFFSVVFDLYCKSFVSGKRTRYTKS